jgi:hypothetical protein
MDDNPRDDDPRPDGPALTIVGGQPLRKGRRHEPQAKIQIPVGLEKLLYLAARDPALKERLLADRAGAIDALGVRLRPSERAILEVVPPAALAAMVGRIAPQNPRKRRFMNLVAAAATSLAAGTAGVACDEVDGDEPINGVDAGAGADTDTDADTDSDGGTDTDTVDTDTFTGVDAGVGSDLDAGAWSATRRERLR